MPASCLRVWLRLVVGAWLAAVALPAIAQTPAADFKLTKAPGGRRVALVVGMSRYQFIPPLDNPKNDATLMANTLRGLGFTLIGGGPQLDLDKPAFDHAVQTFGQQIGGAEAALFYFAGHGLQVRGTNWLVPTNANPTREADIDFQMVDANLVLRQMDGAGTRLNSMILDACRNNPFGGRGLRAVTGGLAQMQAPEGTLISYATQPGNVAADGADGNSPFTKALTQTMTHPGLDVFRLFNEVGLQVKRVTAGVQQPWVSSSPIDGDFYFAAVPLGPAVTAPPPGAAASGAASADADVVFWTSVKDSHNPAQIEAYLTQFPHGTFAGLAKIVLEELKRGQVAALPAKPDLAPAHVESGPAIESAEGAYITVKRATIRETPAADGRLLKMLEPGLPLTVTGKVKDTGWYRVATADGKLRGFVVGDAIQDIKAAEETEWLRVKDAKRSALVVAFLRSYPSGAHAEQAKALRDALATREQAAVTLAAEQKAEADRQADARRRAEEARQADAQRAEADRQSRAQPPPAAPPTSAPTAQAVPPQVALAAPPASDLSGNWRGSALGWTVRAALNDGNLVGELECASVVAFRFKAKLEAGQRFDAWATRLGVGSASNVEVKGAFPRLSIYGVYSPTSSSASGGCGAADIVLQRQAAP